MAKTRRITRSRSQGKTRSQKGGKYGPYPDSAWGFQQNNLGGGWTQFMNSLTLQPGQSSASSQSNDIVPQANINANNQQELVPSNLKYNATTQSGGKKKRRGKKGGSWLGVLNQAVVPFGLLGLQQTYGKRKTRKH
jgi:hypothetical protein